MTSEELKKSPVCQNVKKLQIALRVYWLDVTVIFWKTIFPNFNFIKQLCFIKGLISVQTLPLRRRGRVGTAVLLAHRA